MSDSPDLYVAAALARRYGALGEHPELSREDWEDALATHCTIAGYWDWVATVLARPRDDCQHDNDGELP